MESSKTHETYYLFIFLGTLAILAFGFYLFLQGMNDNSILVLKGTGTFTKVNNSYLYRINQAGIVFTGMFLLSGILFTFMIIIPSKDVRSMPTSVPMPKGDKAATQVSPIMPETEIGQVVEQEADKLRQEVDIEAKKPEMTLPVSEIYEEDSQIIGEYIEGEDDVVFGEAQITDQSLVEFVNQYPDSALKFLFRKNMDGKALEQKDDRIYMQWERRGLTRGKIKQYMLSLLDVDKMPDQPTHEIWKQLRDQIFYLLH